MCNNKNKHSGGASCSACNPFIGFVMRRLRCYKGSFPPPPPKAIRDWNALPGTLISLAEGAEDCVAKFTSGES